MNFQEDHYRNVIHQKDEEIRSAKIENIILNQFINNHFTHGPHPPHQILNVNASFDLHAPPSSYPPYVAYGRPSGPYPPYIAYDPSGPYPPYTVYGPSGQHIPYTAYDPSGPHRPYAPPFRHPQFQLPPKPYTRK